MTKLKLGFAAIVAIGYVGFTGGIPLESITVGRITELRAAPIKETVASLRQIEPDSSEYTIPPAAKVLLTTLKHQLRDLIHTRVNSKYLGTNADEVRATILADLNDIGIAVEDSTATVEDKNYVDEGYIYGEICGVTVEKPEGHPHLLVATTTIGISCGSDTSLYVFQYNGTGWDLTLAEEANDYDDVSGALGRFQWGISQPDRQNNFFVVAANVNPWCTSNWQGLRFKVIRPGHMAYEPRVLLNEKRTIYLGTDFEDERPYRLILRGNRFRLEFLGEKYEKWMNSEDMDLDPDRPGDLDVVSYRIVGDQVILIK
jgi:hypothetical protein